MILRVTPACRGKEEQTDRHTDILIKSVWQYTTETGWLLLTRSRAWVVHSPVFEVDSRVQSSPSHRTAPRGHYNSACVWVWGCEGCGCEESGWVRVCRCECEAHPVVRSSFPWGMHSAMSVTHLGLPVSPSSACEAHEEERFAHIC